MREGTLWLFYISKYLELIFLIVLTILLIIEGIDLMKELETINESARSKKRLPVYIMLPICMVLAVFNVMYNNLLTNLRFKCKIFNKTCGICVYDAVNCCFGFCCMKKFC